MGPSPLSNPLWRQPRKQQLRSSRVSFLVSILQVPVTVARLDLGRSGCSYMMRSFAPCLYFQSQSLLYAPRMNQVEDYFQKIIAFRFVSILDLIYLFDIIKQVSRYSAVSARQYITRDVTLGASDVIIVKQGSALPTGNSNPQEIEN